MKLTKKFWAWVSQVFALGILMFRVDLVLDLFASLGADVSQLHVEIAGVVIFVVLWLLWLIWRGIDGFCRSMDFLTDANGHRW
jgi:hypothetical protein